MLVPHRVDMLESTTPNWSLRRGTTLDYSHFLVLQLGTERLVCRFVILINALVLTS